MELKKTENIKSGFFSQEIDDAIKDRIMGKSYPYGCEIALSELCYIKVLHYGFDGEIHNGELIVNKLIEQDILDIFEKLYDISYPIECMQLVDEYGADDIKSMEANNTSAFNYRVIAGTTKLSNHSYGLAIDINPLYNPYIKPANGGQSVSPVSGKKYTDRTKSCPYYIKKGDTIYQLFTEHGFLWGGDWETVKDYQHFEKKAE